MTTRGKGKSARKERKNKANSHKSHAFGTINFEKQTDYKVIRDRRKDRPTDIVTHRVACTRLRNSWIIETKKKEKRNVVD